MERDSSSIAIVGSRKASPYGLNAAETLAAELAARGLTIVSGGARGIDTRAHRGALKGKGRTVVVAANGLDRTYPRENKALFRQVVDSGGAVISECLRRRAAIPEFPGPQPHHRRHGSGDDRRRSGPAQRLPDYG